VKGFDVEASAGIAWASGREQTRWMGTEFRGGYAALNQMSGRKLAWWERVPKPIATAVLKTWSALPRAVRAPFIPLGRWVNPHQTTSAVSASPGPDIVPGVTELRAQGFAPVEEYTGAFWVAQIWPDQHRRSVAETRPFWLEDPHSDGRLWLTRSPWPILSLEDSLNVLWTWVERDHAPLDEDLWRQRVSEALSWDEPTATEWHRRTVQ
jgi:hypothetical protein